MSGGLHEHQWEDISERGSPYTIERCNGLGGCGTIRRIGKTLYSGWRRDVQAPPDTAWEIMFQGVEGPRLTTR